MHMALKWVNVPKIVAIYIAISNYFLQDSISKRQSEKFSQSMRIVANEKFERKTLSYKLHTNAINCHE